MIDISTKKRYLICQIDVITTFFYQFLDEEIYIMQLIIFENGITQVCFLKKSLIWPKIVFSNIINSY